MIRVAEPVWQWRSGHEHGAVALIKASLARDGRPVSVGEVLAGWRDDHDFRAAWAQWLADIPFKAYCWEMPPLDAARLADPFQCVFIDSPALAMMLADAQPFGDYLSADPTAADTATFANLGGDAWLVAPNPHGDPSAYVHLARFLREAPARQRVSIWSSLAAAIEPRLGRQPLWLSTAGLGVAWLHIRLDSRPKYFRYAPYARGEYRAAPQ